MSSCRYEMLNLVEPSWIIGKQLPQIFILKEIKINFDLMKNQFLGIFEIYAHQYHRRRLEKAC